MQLQVAQCGALMLPCAGEDKKNIFISLPNWELHLVKLADVLGLLVGLFSQPVVTNGKHPKSKSNDQNIVKEESLCSF